MTHTLTFWPSLTSFFGQLYYFLFLQALYLISWLAPNVKIDHPHCSLSRHKVKLTNLLFLMLLNSSITTKAAVSVDIRHNRLSYGSSSWLSSSTDSRSDMSSTVSSCIKSWCRLRSLLTFLWPRNASWRRAECRWSLSWSPFILCTTAFKTVS